MLVKIAAAMVLLTIMVVAQATVDHLEREANIAKHSKPIEWYAYHETTQAN